MTIWLNGEWQNEQLSTGALSGWGVFTTLGVWSGKAFAIDEHLARLRRDAGRAHVPLDCDDDILRIALRETIARNEVRHGAARISLLRRGDGRWNDSEGSDIWVLAKSTPEIRRTFRLAISPYRTESRRALAGVKTTSQLDFLLAAREAQSRGFDDAILLDSQNDLCECSRANLFWTQDETLFTPSLESGCLPGIARAMILDWARKIGIEARENKFSLCELEKADEVFISSSTLGAHGVSVVGFDEKEIEYACGAQTKFFSERWQAAVNK